MHQLTHLRSLFSGSNRIDKVTALAWSPNGRKLAVATLSRIVHLFDENGELKDRFATKPADSKGCKNYTVTAMSFSPDSMKLAIAQSDEIVFIYKLGLEWGDRKCICNKFQETSSIVSVVWPNQHQHEFLFGLTDGKVKMGDLKTNKTTTLHDNTICSSVVSLTCSLDGSTCLVGHLDGSIYRFKIDNSSEGVMSTHFFTHGCVPLVLAWGKSIVAAGSDGKVIIYDMDGTIVRQFDYTVERKRIGFCSGCFSPDGETVIIGHFNGFHMYRFIFQDRSWQDVCEKKVENLYTVSSVAWNLDGSQVAVGTLCGRVDVFDAALCRQKYLGKFELTYITKSKLIIRRLPLGVKFTINTAAASEIIKINIYNDQYLIAHTSETLLLGNLESCKISEVHWHGRGNEKFIIDDPLVCGIYSVGELYLVEYGCNKILGTCQTIFLSPFLISLRVNNLQSTLIDARQVGNKKVAYLADLKTIRVLDLVSGVTAATITHDCNVDWIQLDQQSRYLLFRDKKQQLHLLNVASQEHRLLLDTCTFLGWVPHSNVVVAQKQSDVYVWYKVKNSRQAKIFRIKGEVERINRVDGKTEIIANEGTNIVKYMLDESLIEFNAAVENQNYAHAISILEPLVLNFEIEGMWRELGKIALEKSDLISAERCYAAIGDAAYACYLHKVNKLEDAETRDTQNLQESNIVVEAKLAMLRNYWKETEMQLLEHGHVTEALRMYMECHRWNEAISVAKSNNDVDTKTLCENYHKWLLQTCQVEEAAKLQEAEGNLLGAITLFLDSGLPGHAADCVEQHSSYPFQYDVLERVTEELEQAGMFKKAGKLLERLGHAERAKEAYHKGHVYESLLDLVQRKFPDELVSLKNEWGDWLASQYQVDTAIDHYIAAGFSAKAIESAISSHQWAKAVQILETQNTEVAFPFYKRLAQHFEGSNQYAEAEQFYIAAKLPDDAVRMYIQANIWEDAFKVARKYLSEGRASALYLQRASELEALRYFSEAEKLYLESRNVDLAINMYKKARAYEHMIRLVTEHRKDLLTETHLRLAQQLESEGLLEDAEQHYLEAEDWKSTVKMYVANGMWKDSMRIAKTFGGPNGAKQVAYAWAVSLGGEAGAQLLAKLGLVEQAIEYAIEVGAYDHAFDLCHSSLQHKLPEVHLRYAMFLEDEGRFGEAENEFIKGGKPREAIDMYIHQQDWQAAVKVADLCEPAAVTDIQLAQAELFLKQNELEKAEALFLLAKKTEFALNMYKEYNRWEDAIRIAKDHMPSLVPELNQDFASFMKSQNGGIETFDGIMAQAQAMEQAQDYLEAINLYLHLDMRHTDDNSKLHEVWMKAIDVAKHYAHIRLPEVVHVVAKRFIAEGIYEEAANLYEDINASQEIIEMCIKAGQWDRARQAAAKGDVQLQQHVDKLFKQHLLKTQDAGQLVQTGYIAEALELYAQGGVWDKVHELAGLLGPDKQKEVSLRHAKLCLDSQKNVEAIAILACYGAPSTTAACELCCFLMKDLLGSSQKYSDIGHGIQELRTVLFELGKPNAEFHTAIFSTEWLELKELCLIATYICSCLHAQSQGLQEIVAKLFISLLRYCGIVPSDKAFYEAGIACKQLGWQGMAFVYLNCYLDIAEAIDSPDHGTLLDVSGLETSDVPQKIPVPEQHFISEESREEVRDWIIQLSLDQQVEPTLPSRSCERCGKAVDAASIICFSCKYQNEACCVTGYPVLPHKRVTCKLCDMPANKKDWNSFTQSFERCPWCHKSQQPEY